VKLVVDDKGLRAAMQVLNGMLHPPCEHAYARTEQQTGGMAGPLHEQRLSYDPS